MQKAKDLRTIITLILMSTMLTPFFAIPPASADSSMDTYAFIGATPNPVGVGQEVLLHIGITLQLTNVAMGWDGLSVTITKPDNTVETLSNIRTDSTGGTGRTYTPNMIGNYTLQSHFPQQITTTSKMASGVVANTTMLASDSAKVTLIVQQEQLTLNPGVPLPSEYWTRPINSQFREWYTISGSSWMDNEYNDAPNAPHILWTKPLTIGGLVGGDLGLVGSGATSVGFENGDAYEGKWLKSLILGGNLYYQDAPGTTGSDSLGSRLPTTALPVKYHCVDLRTGNELWSKTFLDNRTITFGQIYYWQSYNYQGSFAYLWVAVGTTWTAFDAASGDYRFTITDVPSGTMLRGPNGEIYLYTVNQASGWMALWNMTALVSLAGSWGSATYGRTYNASSGTYQTATSTGALGTVTTSGAADRAARAWSWNITIPKGLQGSVRAVALDDRVVGSNVNNTDVNIWAFSLKQNQLGTLLYNYDWKAPSSWSAGNQTISWVTTDLTSNIGLVWSKETFQHYGFNLENGQYLWVSEPMQYLSTYSVSRRIYEGRLYATGMTGILYCYDLSTGKTLWTYNVADPYQAEILWSDNWPETIQFATGGKLYLFHSEHSANQPLPRGAPAICLNATNGDVIWRVNGLFRKTDWGGTPMMGDSVIAMYNTYDQQIYAIGKGPSSTAVTASPKVSSFGNQVLIEGYVTDVSPGTKDDALVMRFPNGVPAVSDASQGDWMKYVYAQFPMPTNANGVQVTVSVVDANGNYREIGKTTSSSDGFYSLAWAPDISGEFKVYAYFDGSESYYPSHAETAFVVEQALPTPSSQPETILPPTEMYFAISTAAIIVAIVIVGAVLALILRKRP
jgi:hypothetical protein